MLSAHPATQATITILGFLYLRLINDIQYLILLAKPSLRFKAHYAKIRICILK